MNINSKEIQQLYRQYLGRDIAKTYLISSGGKIELSAEGMYVTADDGRRYLDLAGGYGVFSLGHRHPEVCNAVVDQLGKMPLSTRAMMNPLAAKCAEALITQLPGNEPRTAFFCNSGTEAVEAAIKLSVASTGRSQLIAIEGGFSGKTLGALSCMSKEKYREPFTQILHQEVGWIPRDDHAAARQHITDRVAAVIVEPVQGEGGIHYLNPGFLRTVLQTCEQVGAISIADEVQCGLGRTGKFSPTEYASLCSPDIYCFGKALGGGVMPAAAIVYNEKAGRGIRGKPLLHTNTFGGGQLACAAALKTLEIIKRDQLAERARVMGELLELRLDGLRDAYPDIIADVRGLGLMLGIECRGASEKWGPDEVAGRVIMEAIKVGILLAPALSRNRVIRIEPPLIIDGIHIEEALTGFEEALAQTRKAVLKDA